MSSGPRHTPALPKPLRVLAGVAAFAGGMLAGAFLHYALYRFLLTMEPFIYISF